MTGALLSKLKIEAQSSAIISYKECEISMQKPLHKLVNEDFQGRTFELV